MILLKYSPYFIFTSFLTTLLLDRGVSANGNKRQFPASSPWYPSGPSSESAKISKEESEALRKVLPLVTFDCRGKTGYFPDSKFNCEAFHYCQPDGERNTFHCPANQLFNQLSMMCEAKTVHNSRLCKEGSIISSKLRKIPPNKKYATSQKSNPNLKLSPNTNISKEEPKKVVTLEELLGYMNSGHVGKEVEPTFISRFQKSEEARSSQNHSQSAITTMIPETTFDLDTSKNNLSETQLKAEGSDHSFSVTRVKPDTNSRKGSDRDEDVSTEYDAIEGRKLRKHKRTGQVRDVPKNQQPKKNDKMSSRSSTHQPLPSDTTLIPAGAETKSGNSSGHSLFSTDRSKAKDFRKRKRYQGRKRKITTPEPTHDTDSSSMITSTTSPNTPKMSGQDLDTLRNNVYRRRKSQRTRTREEILKSVQASSKPEKVEPYTLPPLPTPTDDKIEATTESMHRNEKRDPLKEGRSKNPWHRTTPAPIEDSNVKFGEKLPDLDQHYYQTDGKSMENPAVPDYYGTKDMSEELYGEEYKERVLISTKILNSGDSRSAYKSKGKILKKFPQEDSLKHTPMSKSFHHSIISEDIFPPAKPETRDPYSTVSQHMIHDSSAEKSKMPRYSPKVTTDDPFKVTHPYLVKYQADIQELKEIEEKRWKAEADEAKLKDKKVGVGSTFFFLNSENVDATKKPLKTTPNQEDPVEIVHKEKDIPKHTLAQQHLSKIMNDFFAMSSSSTSGRVHLNSNKEEADIVMPDYRIPDEDIYTGSESATDDIEDIPPELLDVVELLTSHVSNEQSDLKPMASHEVIKIDGPITGSHLEQIFLNDKSDEEVDEDGPYKRFVVLPQPEDDLKDIAEMASLASLKLQPFIKQLSNDKSLTVIPLLKPEPVLKRQPTILTAKKIPVRVIYRDQLTENSPPKQRRNRKQHMKFVSSHLPTAHLQIRYNKKRTTYRPVTRTFSSHSRPSIILHPPSLFPPHPPPLPRKAFPFRVGYPFVANSRPFLQNAKHSHRRRKRSIISRLRRQIRQTQRFLPFSSPVFTAFNPKFVPTFSPFKSIFNPISLHTSSSHLTPFTFPGYPLAKPSQTRQQIFRPSHPRPPPVRHVTQSGHQTVIVEEVPVPIHVEVPSPNLVRPASSGQHSAPPRSHPPKTNTRFHSTQFRNPSPPAIQRPPLIQRPQNRFPPPPITYRPIGMPSNIRPPSMNYGSPIPFSAALPPSITSDGQVYALGVTNKPLSPPKPRPGRPPYSNMPRNPPRPYNPFNIHAGGYPNFPYFQGAFTTPISHEPLPGRLMYSGYKPPKSTSGTKSPKKRLPPNKERKRSESKPYRSRTKPTKDYFEAPAKPARESHVSYTEEIISRGRPRAKPSLDGRSTDHSDMKPPRKSSNKGSFDEITHRKRRPGRRRRPRPYSSTTQGATALNDISPTPSPPEQIPPPPADYTSKPAHLDSLPSFSEGSKIHETSSNFPPAGYYGKDQLVQFFDSPSKAYQKTSPKPYYHKDMGESTSSAEMDESFVSMSAEDGNQPAFGTRLRSKPKSQSRSRHAKNKQPSRSQSQNTEIRTRPSRRPHERVEHKKMEYTQTKPHEGSRTQIRNEKPPPRRRRPSPSKSRKRPPPMPTQPTEVRHFQYNENVRNFYTVPRGLQTLVAPSEQPSQGFRGSTDMFGLPHPVIDQSIYSLRPQGAPVDFNTNFFSVPAHVAQQHQSPLHKMNIKPIPESAKDFFTAPEPEATTIPEASAPVEKKSKQKTQSTNSRGVNNEKKEKPPVRKLRKPKRKNRYNPHSKEHRDNTEVNSVKPLLEQTTARNSNTVRYREKATTVDTTTPEPRSTAVASFHSNDIKEAPVFKQRTPLLPKTLPEFSKSLRNGKIDIQKLNATISTSVSISRAAQQNNGTNSEEKENRRVFSSQNGGLAVVRKSPKRKRGRQRISTTTGVPYINNSNSKSDAKYEIAASVLDIIKATTETERQASGYYNNQDENTAPSRMSNVWVESKRQN